MDRRLQLLPYILSHTLANKSFKSLLLFIFCFFFFFTQRPASPKGIYKYTARKQILDGSPAESFSYLFDDLSMKVVNFC